MTGEMSNHLWQTTLFAIAVALLTLAFRKNRAQVRYWLWLSASLKFLIPFSLLMGLGNRLWHVLAARKIATEIASPVVSFTMVQITQPFPDTFSYAPSTPHAINWIFIAVLSIWAGGFAAIALMRFRGWLRVRATVRASTPIKIAAPVEVRSSAALLEPGVVGFLNPVLLLPEGILKSLTPSQLEAVLAHELCHVRRRDNLTAAIHMIVEAVFWFHPEVWWIGARLVEERERACDEAVLSLGSEPHDYVEAILNVCKLYVESPLVCVSGISGSDLKKRIIRIMTHGLAEKLTPSRKVLLTAAAVAAIAGPIAFGAINAPLLGTHEWQTAGSGKMSFDVASVKPDKSGNRGNRENLTQPGGYVSTVNYTLQYLIEKAYFPYHPFGSPNTQFLLSGTAGWMNSEHFDIEARADGNPTVAQKQLMLRSLIEDRFKLVVHQETRQLPVYVLVQAKAGKIGPQLIPHTDNANCVDPATPASAASASTGPSLPACGLFTVSVRDGGFSPVARNVTMESLAANLSGFVGRLVIDRTGISGTFDLTLHYIPGVGQPGAQFRDDAAGSDPSAPPSIFTALQEQLGLKLESQTGPVDVLVVDRAEEPPPN